MSGGFGVTSLSISTFDIRETSTEPMATTPRPLKKKAPKSLPDTSRSAKKLKMNDDKENMFNEENFVMNLPSPSKISEIILQDPDHAIESANEIMKGLVERSILIKVQQISLDETQKLLSHFVTAWKHGMTVVVGACVEKFAMCDVTFLQENCPLPIPVSVLASIYELKLRNSGRPGKNHTISLCDDKFWCRKCGEVMMMRCNDCFTHQEKRWCFASKCVDRCRESGEIICSVTKFCNECSKPRQVDTFIALKDGYCSCSGACCSNLYMDELISDS